MAKTETFPFRYTFYALSLTGFIVSLLASTIWGGWFYLVPVLLGGLAATGTWDLLQRKRTVSRNYPILAHFRYFLESIGPEIRQYFIQSDTDERPFHENSAPSFTSEPRTCSTNALSAHS